VTPAPEARRDATAFGIQYRDAARTRHATYSPFL